MRRLVAVALVGVALAAVGALAWVASEDAGRSQGPTQDVLPRQEPAAVGDGEAFDAQPIPPTSGVMPPPENSRPGQDTRGGEAEVDPRPVVAVYQALRRRDWQLADRLFGEALVGMAPSKRHQEIRIHWLCLLLMHGAEDRALEAVQAFIIDACAHTPVARMQKGALRQRSLFRAPTQTYPTPGGQLPTGGHVEADYSQGLTWVGAWHEPTAQVSAEEHLLHMLDSRVLPGLREAGVGPGCLASAEFTREFVWLNCRLWDPGELTHAEVRRAVQTFIQEHRGSPDAATRAEVDYLLRAFPEYAAE